MVTTGARGATLSLYEAKNGKICKKLCVVAITPRSESEKWNGHSKHWSNRTIYIRTSFLLEKRMMFQASCHKLRFQRKSTLYEQSAFFITRSRCASCNGGFCCASTSSISCIVQRALKYTLLSVGSRRTWDRFIGTLGWMFLPLRAFCALHSVIHLRRSTGFKLPQSTAFFCRSGCVWVFYIRALMTGYLERIFRKIKISSC